jgi:hypothetical protein
MVAQFLPGEGAKQREHSPYCEGPSKVDHKQSRGKLAQRRSSSPRSGPVIVRYVI